jgi:hypothetical protein
MPYLNEPLRVNTSHLNDDHSNIDTNVQFQTIGFIHDITIRQIRKFMRDRERVTVSDVGASFGSLAGSAPRSPWEALPTSTSFSSGVSSLSVSDGECLQLSPEVESGNVEYKLKLCHPTVSTTIIPSFTYPKNGFQSPGGTLYPASNPAQMAIARWEWSGAV